MAYSEELCERLLADIDEGVSAYVAAERYRVSVSFIYQLGYRRRDRGTISPSKSRGHRWCKLSPEQVDRLRAYIAGRDVTLEEIRLWLEEAEDVKISIGALWNTLEREGISYKKNRTRRGAGPA